MNTGQHAACALARTNLPGARTSLHLQHAIAAASLGLALLMPTHAVAQRPPTSGHVAELARYLNRVEIAEPIVYRHLAVFPVLLEGGADLPGKWLTLDTAMSRGVLTITEKGAGSVPIVSVENRSPDEHVFLMAGEVLAGGKQTRTVRRDVILAPGQKIDLDVFCVEEHRWQGDEKFSSGKLLLPPSIQQELRRGADQHQVWSEVARNNAALQAENTTGSLELALKAAPVQRKLAEVDRSIAPNIPAGTVGFLLVARGRAVGAEFFGREDMARALFPKLLGSYAVDFVVLDRGETGVAGRPDHRTAIEFFERICRGSSQRSDTAGSGAGIRMREGKLLGDGVSLSNSLVHFGVQADERIAPLSKPRPRRIWP